MILVEGANNGLMNYDLVLFLWRQFLAVEIRSGNSSIDAGKSANQNILGFTSYD